MPFSLEDHYRAINHLNFALIKSLPYLATQSQKEFYTYDAQLNPSEYYANMPIPRLFEQEDISDRMDKITPEFSVRGVIEILDELDELADRLKQERSSPNFALVEASKLKWNQESRTAGMEMQRNELIDRLRYFLKLPPVPPIDGCASLGRS